MYKQRLFPTESYKVIHKKQLIKFNLVHLKQMVTAVASKIQIYGQQKRNLTVTNLQLTITPINSQMERISVNSCFVKTLQLLISCSSLFKT